MNRIAILGSYPIGPETTAADEIKGKWSPWKHGGTIPTAVWVNALPSLNRMIKKYGFVHIYNFYGEKQPLEQVARVDRIKVSDDAVQSPGPTFEFARNEVAQVWLRYSHTSKLAPPIPHKELMAIGPTKLDDAEPRKLTTGDWHHMHIAGLIFIVDPKGVGGWV